MLLWYKRWARTPWKSAYAIRYTLERVLLKQEQPDFRKRRNIMARHNTVQASSFSSLEHLDMYENTVSGRDSTEAAYLQLRGAILCNELPSGKHLSQRELEQRFGVGRTPLRKTLPRLLSVSPVITHQ